MDVLETTGDDNDCCLNIVKVADTKITDTTSKQ